MKRTIAIPYAVLAKGDPDELAQYGDQPLTPEEADAREEEAAEAEAHRAANEWRDNRKAEYPAITDQLDAIMKWVATGDRKELEAIAEQCMDVKSRNQKPE
jgi:hypothetical protein